MHHAKLDLSIAEKSYCNCITNLFSCTLLVVSVGGGGGGGEGGRFKRPLIFCCHMPGVLESEMEFHTS